MSPLHVQTFLRAGGTLAELTATRAIKVRRHPEHANLVHLKYDQIASPMGDPIVQECRALILDEANDWSIVAHPFHKFFNHGEGHAAPIDWPTARVAEKVDGSLCILYFYGETWHVATTGTPDGCGRVGQHGITFRELFFTTLGECGISLPVALTPTYMLELTTPENRVVVPHSTRGVTLLGVRLADGTEVAPALGRLTLWGGPSASRPPVVRDFPLQSLADVEATFAALSPLSTEGYVISDAAFNRIKVKHPGYVALHHAISSLSNRALAEVVRSGESSEVEAHFPEIAKLIAAIRVRHVALLAEIASDYDGIASIPVQKDFALRALKTVCPAALFAIRAKKAGTPAEFLRGMPIDGYLRLAGLKDEPTAESEVA